MSLSQEFHSKLQSAYDSRDAAAEAARQATSLRQSANEANKVAQDAEKAAEMAKENFSKAYKDVAAHLATEFSQR